MLKRSLPLLAAIAGITPLHATDLDELTIAAGETYQAQGDLKLNKLIMEDGATLLAPNGVKQWRIEVDQAWLIGKSFINANGQSGNPGGVTPTVFGKTSKCEDGHPGHPGGNGENG